MRTIVIIVGVLAVSGCGQGMQPSAPTALVEIAEISTDGGHVIRPQDLRYSCPNGDVLPLSVNTREGVAKLTWPAKNVDTYHIPVERETMGKWELMELMNTPGDTISRGLLETSWGGGEGRYRARVATLNRCGQLGTWGPWVEWVFDASEVPARPTPPPVVRFAPECRYCHGG